MSSYLTIDDVQNNIPNAVYMSAYSPDNENHDDWVTMDLQGTYGTILSFIRDTYNDAENITIDTAPQSFAMLQQLQLNLMLYKIYTRYAFTEMPDNVTEQYNNVIFRLKDIQSGKQKLPDWTQKQKSFVVMSSFKANAFKASDMW